MKTNLIISLFTVFFLPISCNKEENLTSRTYIEEDYYPGSPELVKQEVISFLKTSKHNPFAATKSLSDYTDRELSEAKWILEATSNYLKNVNISEKYSSEEAFTISFNLFEENGELKVDGLEMSDKFDDLLDQLIIRENALNRNVKLLDFDIISVDNLIADIKVTAIFGSGSGNGTNAIFPDDLYPFDVFAMYSENLLAELGPVQNQFYTNIQYGGIYPYTYISNQNDPNYFPQQDPNNALYNSSLPRCDS